MEQEFVSEAEKLKSEGVVSEYYITNSNEDIKEDVKAEKEYQMIIETCMKCIKNFIICYIWRRITILRHFFELKIP